MLRKVEISDTGDTATCAASSPTGSRREEMRAPASQRAECGIHPNPAWHHSGPGRSLSGPR
jgi:hypothetical protein